MSLKENFIYSVILTSANYVFPMLVFPYISRVLGVENVGICNFIDSIVNYFVLFSMMGIASLGIREIASCNNKQERNIVFSSLILLNAIFTFIAIVGLIVVTYTVKEVAQYKSLMYVGVLKLISNFLLLEWLYKGLEDFKYITKRTLIVKCIYVLSIFIFVRNCEDYVVYYLLTTLMITINSLINIAHSKQLVIFSFYGVKIKKYFKPFISLGYYMLLTTMYNSFNITFLGFIATKKDVGDFSTAAKLFAIIVALFTAVSNVIMPRASSLINEGNKQAFQHLIYKSISGLLLFALPTLIFMFCYTEQIVSILFGKEFSGMVVILRIIVPLLLIVGYEQILIMQVIMPNKIDKGLTICSTAGAIIGISLNVLLVPSLTSIGSSIAWVASELTVLLLGQYIVTKKRLFKFPLRNSIKHILAYVPLLAVCWYFRRLVEHHFYYLIIFSLIIIAFSLLIEIFILKNEMVVEQYKKILKHE